MGFYIHRILGKALHLALGSEGTSHSPPGGDPDHAMMTQPDPCFTKMSWATGEPTAIYGHSACPGAASPTTRPEFAVSGTI